MLGIVLRSSFAKQSFAGNGVPNLEIGNEINKAMTTDHQ